MIVEVVLPSAVTEAEETEIVVCAVVAEPGVKVTAAESVIAEPPMVPLIVMASATVLVIIDGEPRLKTVDDSKLEYVLNTAFFIVKK